MALDLSPVFAVLMFVLTLVLCIRPFRGVGILNLIFGLVGILISVATFTLDTELPFHPWFSVTYGLVSVVCILVGTRGGADGVLA